jgi:hypothetical protein
MPQEYYLPNADHAIELTLDLDFAPSEPSALLPLPESASLAQNTPASQVPERPSPANAVKQREPLSTAILHAGTPKAPATDGVTPKKEETHDDTLGSGVVSLAYFIALITFAVAIALVVTISPGT